VVSPAVAVVTPDVMVALLLMSTAPVGLFTVTAKVALPLAPTAKSPTISVQDVPAGSPFAQLQALLAPELNVVSAGTASVSVTPVRGTLPVFW
jgi:hypothetical protein